MKEVACGRRDEGGFGNKVWSDVAGAGRGYVAGRGRRDMSYVMLDDGGKMEKKSTQDRLNEL